MKKRRDTDTEAGECSFCGKAQFVVRKLICNASDFPRRVYICDECVMVCASILTDDSWKFAGDPVSIESTERHPALDNPLTSQFLRHVERWTSLESAGFDSTAEFAELRSMARCLFDPKR